MHTSRRILILSSNPGDTHWLQTDAELLSVWERLQQHQGFAVRTKTAATLDTVRTLQLDEQPELLHFAGHGENDCLLLSRRWDVSACRLSRLSRKNLQRNSMASPKAAK